MVNVIEVSYSQTGESTKVNEFGMREMQQRAYAYRDAQYLLLKAPPASGKSRALMFVALDKLTNQGIKKVIVAVPERSIGASFRPTPLKQFGFFADWEVAPDCDLCGVGSDDGEGKIKKFIQFLKEDSARVLICTHATLRHAYPALDNSAFDGCLLAIDEFHHVSADSENNRLGDLLHGIMGGSTAHVLAMTGSYFRGDGVPVLLPQDEEKFQRVTYNYYEQLNGYTYLKSLGIGHHFYQGKYLSAIGEVLDTNKKTIIHIPSVNSAESPSEDKYAQVDAILDKIGTFESKDPVTGLQYIKRHGDGRIIKVADLVNDDPREREKVVGFLRGVRNVDDVDIIIALGMAKEGFDWAYCEHTLTVGYRSSLTEIVQIIGRCTRDSANKTHAQFTNLIAQPDAKTQEVAVAVNNMLKAISCSLLMEQVLAPNFKFKTKLPTDTETKPGVIKIRGFKEPTAKVKKILESDLNDLKAKILQDQDVLNALPNKDLDPAVINKQLIPKIIRESYPDLTEEEVEQMRQTVVADSAFKTSRVKEEGNKRFIEFANRFINIDELSVDLIDSINPFQRAYEILSKALDKKTFRAIQEAINMTRIELTEEEAVRLFKEAQEFFRETERIPDVNSPSAKERQYAAAILYLKKLRQKMGV